MGLASSNVRLSKEITRLNNKLDKVTAKATEYQNKYIYATTHQEEIIRRSIREGIKLAEQSYINEIKALKKELTNALKQIERYRTYAQQTSILLKKRTKELKEASRVIAYYKVLEAHDGTNTGMPTSQTPINKKKHIPNSRKPTRKHKGGQKNHTKHELDIPSKDAIDEVETHDKSEQTTCPYCGSKDCEGRGVYDSFFLYELKQIAQIIQHNHERCYCHKCKRYFAEGLKSKPHSKCSYGPNINSLIVYFSAFMNVPYNKIADYIEEISDGKLHVSVGYMVKLMQKTFIKLKDFLNQNKTEILKAKLVYWDDTVIIINTKRGILRFYGTGNVCLYTAHQHKDLKSIEDDKLLELLLPETTVMHDHNTVNYNDKFMYRNIECLAHLIRDFKRISIDTKKPEGKQLAKLFSKAIEHRKSLLTRGIQNFFPEYITRFKNRLHKLLNVMRSRVESDTDYYGKDQEKAMLKRFEKYEKNYTDWLNDFSLPTTNNLSERSLRPVKSKLKAAGQFINIRSVKIYAAINSYTQTCHINGVNIFQALKRLCTGHPFTLSEIMAFNSS